MSHRSTAYEFNPVLDRFAEVRELWLGLTARSISRTTKLRKTRQITLKTRLKRLQKRLAKSVAVNALNLTIAISLLVGVVWFGPRVLFTLFPTLGSQALFQDDQAQAEDLSGDFTLGIDEARLEARNQPSPTERNYKPPYNENLPEGDWLTIPRIGVRSTLQPTERYEDALETGLWLVPDFGRPGDRELPMIVAGHRFGFQWWWQSDYWKYHSFYSLPELEPGDTIEVISGKRKYVYEIYAGEEGTEITDYDADLIVYTCKHLDSPIRIFRYAKLNPSLGDTPLGIL